MDDDHSFIFNFWLNVPAKLIYLQKLQLDLGQNIKIVINFYNSTHHLSKNKVRLFHLFIQSEALNETQLFALWRS